MKQLNALIISVMIGLLFSLNTFAVSLSSNDTDISSDILDLESLLRSDIEVWKDSDGDFFRQIFLAEGNIFIEYGYFQDRVDSGLDFIAQGKVSFFPTFNPNDLPVFSQFHDEYGVAYTDGAPADYWVGVNSTIDVDTFISHKNIYVIGNGTIKPVPIPAAAWFFLSGLSLLALRRRVSARN